MATCNLCLDSVGAGVVTIHATPEVVREMVDSINRGDVRSMDGKRMTVAVVDAGADGHVSLTFTQHEDGE